MISGLVSEDQTSGLGERAVNIGRNAEAQEGGGRSRHCQKGHPTAASRLPEFDCSGGFLCEAELP